MHAQVAIVLFRTLVEFYDTPLGLGTLPLMMWRFATIGIGSILTGKVPLHCLHTLHLTQHLLRQSLRRSTVASKASHQLQHFSLGSWGA